MPRDLRAGLPTDTSAGAVLRAGPQRAVTGGGSAPGCPCTQTADRVTPLEHRGRLEWNCVGERDQHVRRLLRGRNSPACPPE